MINETNRSEEWLEDVKILRNAYYGVTSDELYKMEEEIVKREEDAKKKAVKERRKKYGQNKKNREK